MRAILHIGTEKTGTTTIQHSLAENRGRLAAYGVHYPFSPGDPNHVNLATYAMDPGRNDSLRAGIIAQTDSTISDHIRRFAADLESELDRLPGHTHTVVFSNEHCHSRLVSIDEVRRLADLLRQHFREVEILVYLRRQDELAVSSYTTRLRAGSTEKRILPHLRRQMLYFDYEQLLHRWSTAFGSGAIKPRIFERTKVLSDFACAVGLPEEFFPSGHRAWNPSLVPVAQEYLRLINVELSHHAPGKASLIRRNVVAFLDRNFAGVGRIPPRHAAKVFFRHFSSSNERVRETWFPDRPTLFSESFERYPEHPPRRADPREVNQALESHWMKEPGLSRQARGIMACAQARLNHDARHYDLAAYYLSEALKLDPDLANAEALKAEWNMAPGSLD